MPDEAGAPSLDPIEEGLRLFNEGYFFEAHEVLEDLWRQERGEPRLFLQGLIQVCAGFHHLQNGNPGGAAALLERGIEKMRRYPDRYLGFDVPRLVSRLEDARSRIMETPAAARDSVVDYPKIQRNQEP